LKNIYLDFQFLLSSNYAALNVSNIKLLNGFLNQQFIYMFVVKLQHVCLLHRHYPVPLESNILSVKMYD